MADSNEEINTELRDKAQTDNMAFYKSPNLDMKTVDSELEMKAAGQKQHAPESPKKCEKTGDSLDSHGGGQNISIDSKKGTEVDVTDQLCRDMQKKLQLQCDAAHQAQTNLDSSHQKPQGSRPRSVFTYATEQIATSASLLLQQQDQSIIAAIPNLNSLQQPTVPFPNYLQDQNISSATIPSQALGTNLVTSSKLSEAVPNFIPANSCEPNVKTSKECEFNTTLRATSSTPNTTTSKMSDYFSDYERNMSGVDSHHLNQTISDFDFSSKYYAPRITHEFDSQSFQFGQSTAPFRPSSLKDSDYNINGKINKETQIGNSSNQIPNWRSTNNRINVPTKIPLQIAASNTIIPTLPPPMSAMNYYNTDEMQHYTAVDNWRDHELMEPGTGGAMATPHGTITLRLHDRVRVDMTLDRAVRVVNFKNNIVVSVSATGSASGLLHPNGRVYQYGSRVEILAHDQHSHNNKYAKMWYKGVSFTSDQCALVYLVDSAGTRTTTDTFSDLSQDFSLSIFYNESRHGPQFVQEAMNVLQSSQYWITEDGTENWIINNVRISQTADGLVRIGRNSNKFTLRTSPANGSASVSSPYVHCTGSLGQTSHLFVRRGERRMHYDGASFIVRNAGHSAGFDDKHQLKVY